MGNILHRLLSRRNVQPEFRRIQPNHTVDDSIHIKSKAHPNYQCADNSIRTTKYTILTFLPKNLFEQLHRFANVYFILIVVLNWIPQVQAFAKEVAALPVVFVLLVTAIKDAYEDVRRYYSDRAVNNNMCMVYSKVDNHYVKTYWSQIHAGDFVHISCNAVIPADILFIRSSDPQAICHIETSNIDGESNLKQREVVQLHPGISESESVSPAQFVHSVYIEQPNPEIYSFKGYIDIGRDKIILRNTNLLLRGCILRNTDFIEGLVVYAGSETKAMQNNKGPRHKISKLETKINRDVIWCIIILLFMCFFCAIGSGIWLSDYITSKADLAPFVALSDDEQHSPVFQGFLVFWTYIIIFQSVIPLPLYVSLELVKLGQVYFIMQDVDLFDQQSNRPVECRALNITEDLGQIEYVFSDKTGTLTENKMEFKCCTVGGVNYPHAVPQNYGAEDNHSDRDSRVSFSSRTSCIMDNLILEPALERELRHMSLRSMDSRNLVVPLHVCRVQEFFLLMAVCNTVVVSHHKHADVMDASGNIDDAYFKTGGPDMPKSSLTDQLKKMKPESFRFERSNSLLSGSESSISSASTTQLEEELHYEAESPDELALVRAACTYGVKLLHRLPNKVKVKLPGEPEEVYYDILKILYFDSTRKRMSVFIKHRSQKLVTMYVKGADSNIFDVLHPRYTADPECMKELQETMTLLNNYAKMGLRTLCMAKKVLSEREFQDWLVKHRLAELAVENSDVLIMESACRIETDLELLGATGIEDQLQEGVPSAISQLQAAGIKVWVLTGDKQETAIQIAHSTQLFPEEAEPIIINADSEEAAKAALEIARDQILAEMFQQDVLNLSVVGSQESLLSGHSFSSSHSFLSGRDHKRFYMVIDGPTLNFATSPNVESIFLSVSRHCQSVVCCRATPIQKATVVKLVRDRLKKMTLAIGDGANDVSMIQTADIGVGISGQEGMQAVMASDFSIAKFRFLERLLLVHGHWNYDRLANFAAVMFYKNILSVLVLFWYQIFSGFSGSLMIDSLYLTMQHVIFTAAPPLANGILDKDLNVQTLLDCPSLYIPGQQGMMYTQWTFLVVTVDTIYQSLIIYFLPHVAYDNHSVGIWEFGTTIDVCMILCILLHLSIETRSWVWIQFAAIVLSFTLFWSVLLISNAIFFTFDHPSNPYWVMENTIATATHSAVVLVTCFVALLPRLIVRIVQLTLFPNEITKARCEEKVQPDSTDDSSENENSTLDDGNQLNIIMKPTGHQFSGPQVCAPPSLQDKCRPELSLAGPSLSRSLNKAWPLEPSSASASEVTLNETIFKQPQQFVPHIRRPFHI